MIKSKKIVICGSAFGEYYLRAIANSKENLEIVGLLAQGSQRSCMVAEKYHISLLTNVDEIPLDVDLACVVIRSEGVGGKGTEIACELLQRGINVLQEQPVHLKYAEECYKLAYKKKAIYKVSDLYAKLDEVSVFIKCAQALNKIEKPIYVRVAFSTQVAFPAINILMNSLPSVRNFNVDVFQKNNGLFDVYIGEVGEIPILIEFGNVINPDTPDSNMYIMHQFSYVYSSGILSLENTFGPVTWRPKISFADRANNKSKPINILTRGCDVSINQVFETKFIDAIEKEICDVVFNKKNYQNSMQIQRGMLCAKTWTDLTKKFGYANMDTLKHNENICLAYLESIVRGTYNENR